MKPPSETQTLLIQALGKDELAGTQLLRRTGNTIPVGTVFTTLSRLADRGWVATRPCNSDGRVTFFRLTPKGCKALHLVNQLQDTLNQILAL